jgi:putative tricarboxylic transport membrane protein
VSDATTTSDSSTEHTGGRQDLVAGALAAVLGAAVLLHVRGFPQLPDGQPGPALFPGLCGALLVLFGLTLAGRGLLAHRHARSAAEGTAERSAPSTTTARLNVLAVLGSVVVYLLVVDVLGFGLTMGLLLVGLMWRLGARPIVALAAGVATTILIMLLFQRLLLVPLPTGLLG